MIWILALIVSEIILLFLPVYIYDLYFWKILIFAALIQFFFINRIEKVILKKENTTGLFLLLIVFAITNYFVYDFRKENAFLTNPVNTTTGVVIGQYRQGGGRSSERYYIEYEFTAKTKRYKHVDEVKFWVWFNYKFHQDLEIEYVRDNPKISRINKSSLIEYPEHEELLKRVNEGNRRKK